MFISFPAMVSQWVELVSLAYSLRNDMPSDEHVLKCSKTGSGLLSLFSRQLPRFCQVKLFRHTMLGYHWVS